MIFTPKAPLLAIDTAGSACSVALWAGRSVLAHEVTATLHGHAVTLAPMIARLAAGARIDLKALGAIAVSCGPGGFTGMRVGLATARAMALAIGCPAIGIGSFQVLAATALRSAGTADGNILAVLDSRREELFAAELNPSLTPAAEPALLRMEDVAALVRSRGLRLIAEADLTDFTGPLFADIPVHLARPDATAVAELAALRPDLHLAADPIYLRPPDVSQPKPALVPAAEESGR
jgi:tRNA threonylcarbamoyladenosine biosynthesis protein TsaB